MFQQEKPQCILKRNWQLKQTFSRQIDQHSQHEFSPMEFLCFPMDVRVYRVAYRGLFDIVHWS